jgi:hypothetical protein
MKRKGLLFILFLSFLIILPFVSAATQNGVLSIFKELGTFLFKDLPALGDYGFKFLLWIALFALFNFGLKATKLDPKTAGIVAFVLSLLCVLLLKGSAIKGIFATYAVIIALLLGVVIPILLIWAVNTWFPGTTVHGRLLRGVCYLIIAYALFAFVKYAQGGLIEGMR